MNLTPHIARDILIGDLATANTQKAKLYFKEAALITSIAVTLGTTVAAHATTTVEVTVTDKGIAGAGTTVVGVVGTDSDLPSTATRKTGAMTADIAQVLDLGASNALVLAARGHVSGYAVAAGSVLDVSLVNAAGVTLADATVTLTYRPGTN